ncbi:MAG: ISKra4 family transposase, partial [Candidatus Methanoperedens sp.]
DIEGTSFSPGVRRIMTRVGTYRPFALGHEDIKEMAGIDVAAKEIERTCNKLGQQAEKFFEKRSTEALSEKIIPIKAVPKMYICMDGTGVPMVKKELLNRQGKGEDGQAKTREAKLGCVFTQTGLDKKGRPVRDEASTSYVGAIETSEVFGKRIYAEAKQRGIDRAKEVVVLGDGATWIWNIAEECFPGAIQIIDLYHAREHYWKVGRAVLDHDKKKLHKWADKRRKELDKGQVEKVIEAIRQLSPYTGQGKEVCEKTISYFEKNKDRMRYNVFRRRGFFVGSGVLEAGCRAVIGQRLKQSGMHWSLDGANHIIALRCCLFSNRWEDFWETRAAA